MSRQNRVIGLIILIIGVVFIYFVFFIFNIESIPIYLVLTIGSVATLSAGTIYTVIQSKNNSYRHLKKKAILQQTYSPKKKALRIQANELVEDYFDANPLVDNYADSNEPYENFPRINDYIFSAFRPDQLEKMNLLGFSKMDKIFFMRELLYFDPAERDQLIDDIMKNKDAVHESMIYTPPSKIIVFDEKIRVYIRSLVEPGEKTKIIIVDTSDFINVLKRNISILFDYNTEDFLLSSGGILLDEASQINNYNIEDDDEIALIPLRRKEK
jgi:hypothetical protein